jgi:inosose dehydratase
MAEMSQWTRREALKAGLAGAAMLSASGVAMADSRTYGPFRVGLQSYSLRAFDLATALDMTRALALRYWEATQTHVPLTSDPAAIRRVLAAFSAHNVALTDWGVQAFDGDPDQARRVFQFAHAMGIRHLSADPAPAAFPVLEKLCAEYRILIGIHNHGPGARYATIAQLEAALHGTHPGIGVCLDTGHLLRSGEDPVEAVRKFGSRIHGVHLKDVKDRRTFTIVGQGDLDVVGLFRELHKQRYRGLIALEYEEKPEAPGPDINLCLQATQDAIEKAVRR